MPQFSTTIQIIWKIAALEADEAGHELIEKEHVMLGLCSLDKVLSSSSWMKSLEESDQNTVEMEAALVSQTFAKIGLDPVKCRRLLRNMMGAKKTTSQQIIHRSAECKQYFQSAITEAIASGETESVAAEHLLVAILAKPGATIGKAFQQMAITYQIEDLRKVAPKENVRGETPLLDRFGIDLVEKYAKSETPFLYGRDQELLALARALTRKTRNNPLLVGDAGVGKTCIVEGLAFRIARGGIMPEIRDLRIIQVDIGRLIAGACYRGEFEERLTGMFDEAVNNPQVVLFFDEIHTLLGGGKSEWSQEAAQLVKPVLGQGAIRCIGTTTWDEYARYIESDPALERRFQMIRVNEPSPGETKEILMSLRPKMESHYGVNIFDAAIDAIIEMTVQYLPARRFPDKAIDLLDEACARLKMSRLTFLPGSTESHKREVTDLHIAETLEIMTGVPLSGMAGNWGPKMLLLENELKSAIVGQEAAIEAVVNAVFRAQTIRKRESKPIGVFFFAGPSGVGKTQLAKSLATSLFGSEKAMIRIDMSEYQERHSLSRLIGAPPGYIGHDADGQLSGALRKNPFSIVLLDEAEKAHMDIWNLFLQVFDDGRLTDSHGRTISAEHAVFIVTSNLSLSKPRSPLGFGGGATKEIEGKSLRHALIQAGFRPEFVNRLDEIIEFHPLTREHLHIIAEKSLCALQMSLPQVSLEIGPEIIPFLCNVAFEPFFGARPLQRLIEQAIANPLAALIANNKGNAVIPVRIFVEDQKIQFRSQS